MATTEIEKLERRYAENPQGLTFAPLAEIHRKNGDVARALELLRAGLELHPNYIPASIVLGRCHWDLGDLAAAESAFSHVLRLDDENVIALKSLADINEKLGRVPDAQRWLNRLISVDRSNEEARQQLARLELGKSQPPAPAAPAPQDVPAAKAESVAAAPPPAAPAEPVRSQPPAAPLDLAVELTEPTPPASSRPAASAEPPPAEASAPTPPLEFIDTSASGTPSRTPPEGATAEPKPVDGLISSEFVPPRDSYRSHPELTQEFVSPTEPPRSPDDELGDLEVEMMEEVELQSSGASEFRVPNAAEDFMEAAAPPPPPAALPQPSPVSAAPPRNEPKPTPPEAPSEPTRKTQPVQETRGQSVAAFFAALLSARPSGDRKPAAPGSSPAPAPGPLAGAEVSFDDFFGTAEPSRLPKPDSEAGKEDLDQFQSWLQNLKR